MNFGPNEGPDCLRTGSGLSFEQYWGVRLYGAPIPVPATSTPASSMPNSFAFASSMQASAPHVSEPTPALYVTNPVVSVSKSTSLVEVVIGIKEQLREFLNNLGFISIQEHQSEPTVYFHTPHIYGTQGVLYARDGLANKSIPQLDKENWYYFFLRYD